MGALVYFVIIIGVFYFFMIAPEKKKQNKAKDMVNSLKVGDEILTRGGIQGTIIELSETLIVIATGPDKVKITITRSAVGSVTASAPIEEYEDDEEYEYVDEDEEYEEESEDENTVSLDKKN